MDDTLRRESAIVDEVLNERRKQENKWGVQDHPSVRESKTGHGRCGLHGMVSEETAKQLCEYNSKRGTLAWGHIAVEELAEAISAPGDMSRREELVQLAAVIVAWIENIDRNTEALQEELI